MRRMGRSNLSGALAVDWPQDRRTLRTHPTRRPREDVFSAGAEPVISLCNFPAFSATGSGSRRNGGAVPALAELATIDPHPMQNDDVLDNMANFGAVRMALTSPGQPGRRSEPYQQ